MHSWDYFINFAQKNIKSRGQQPRYRSNKERAMYIFDFDGTLMDTSAVILSTIKATVKEMGLPERTDAQ